MFSTVIHKMLNHIRDMGNLLLFTVCFVFIIIIHLKNRKLHCNFYITRMNLLGYISCTGMNKNRVKVGEKENIKNVRIKISLKENTKNERVKMS